MSQISRAEKNNPMKKLQQMPTLHFRNETSVPPQSRMSQSPLLPAGPRPPPSPPAVWGPHFPGAAKRKVQGAAPARKPASGTGQAERSPLAAPE